MSSNFLANIRLGTFGKTIHSVCCLLFWVAEEGLCPATTLLFSLIVLCISADLVSLTNADSFYGFSGLSLTTSLLTLITVGPMCDQIFWGVGLFAK
jgi:hypothetical protein